MADAGRILVTGATGKVGQNFIRAFLADKRFDGFVVRALCHNRMLEPHSRLEVVKGSIEHQEVVHKAMQDVTHVLHMATCKETPDQIMDVAIKGMFWLLEACVQAWRDRHSLENQFILIGGDAGVGHCVVEHPIPVTETQKHTPYPGCYALSKVLEEVMLEQYYIQYNLNGCCLRAPWIMEKDDFKYQASFGQDVFGGILWRSYVGDEKADEYARTQTFPIMLDADGKPIRRNFVHVDDLVSSILCAIDHPKAKQQTFNICMDEPVDYGRAADYLKEKYGLPSVPVQTLFYSNWLDNSKARFLLGWQPEYDLKKMIDAAWSYQRAADEPRKIWYPG